MQQRIFATAFLLVAVLSAGLSVYQFVQNKRTIHDWQRVGKIVHQQFERGDAVVLSAPYEMSVQKELGNLPFFYAKAMDPIEIGHYSRIWWLGPHERRPGSEIQSRLIADKEKQFVDLPIELFFVRDFHRAHFDLRRDIQSAKVTAFYETNSGTACDRFDRSRWICPRDAEWSWVGAKTAVIGGTPKDVVWVHPLPSGQVLQIELPIFTQTRVISGGYGYTDDASRRAAADAELTLMAGAEILWKKTILREQGWHSFSTTTTSTEPVKLLLATPNNGAAHVCLNVFLSGSTSTP